jgi:NTP pyrophosphatase (non-canonical NTP hydrolase)
VNADLLAQLDVVNPQRCARWHDAETEQWSLADWSNAMCGEAGEAANVVKKIRRHETRTGAANLPPLDELRAQLAHEIADTVLYAHLLAHFAGVDFRAAIVEKFNLVSERQGFPEQLTLDADSVRQVRDDEREQMFEAVLNELVCIDIDGERSEGFHNGIAAACMTIRRMRTDGTAAAARLARRTP